MWKRLLNHRLFYLSRAAVAGLAVGVVFNEFSEWIRHRKMEEDRQRMEMIGTAGFWGPMEK